MKYSEEELYVIVAPQEITDQYEKKIEIHYDYVKRNRWCYFVAFYNRNLNKLTKINITEYLPEDVCENT